MADIEIIKGADNGNPPDTLRQMYPKVNRNFTKINNQVTSHINSTAAHKADNITYSGQVPGEDVKEAIENVNSRISEIVAQAGDDNTEVVDARGGYTVLGDRLNASDVHLDERTAVNLNIERSLRKWRSKLARVKSGVANQTAKLVIVGDSITEGAWAGGGMDRGDSIYDWSEGGFVRRIQKELMSEYGDAGMGMIPSYYQREFSPKWSFNGLWETITGYGGIAGNSMTTTVNGDSATFTFNGNGVRVVYSKHMFAGTWTYSVDGSTPVPVNTNSDALESGVVLDITGLPDGDHTLVITNTGSDKILLTGAIPLKNHSGVIVDQCGLNGSTTGDHSTDDSLNCTINATSPDLTIVALGCNDYGTQVPIDTFKANLQKIVTRALQFGDVILASIGLSAFVGSIPQSEYFDAMREVARTNNVVFLDLANRWGNDATYARETLWLLSDDYVHPNDFGHQDIASFIIANIKLA